MYRLRHFSFYLLQAVVAVGVPVAVNTLNGAELFSRESVKFGRWEIRMCVAATPGSVSSFFTYYSNSYFGLPEPWREIDIEALGNNSHGFQSNLITGDAAARINSVVFHSVVSDLSKGFHTYALEWTPDSIVYRLDGQTLRKIEPPDPQLKDLSDMAQTYRMNLWASTSPSWTGTLDPETLPVIQTVNWIAYSSYTPGQGPNGSDFTPQWTDDFDTLDTLRWSRGDWTFDGNMADFVPENAFTHDGYLVLFLSRKGWTGDVAPSFDPAGNTRTATFGAMIPKRVPFQIKAFGGQLRLDVGNRNSDVAIANLDGRIIARASGMGIIHIDDLPRGILLVRFRNQSILVPMP